MWTFWQINLFIYCFRKFKRHCLRNKLQLRNKVLRTNVYRTDNLIFWLMVDLDLWHILDSKLELFFTHNLALKYNTSITWNTLYILNSTKTDVFLKRARIKYWSAHIQELKNKLHSAKVVPKKEIRGCYSIIAGANSILFGMSLADDARIAQEVLCAPLIASFW